MRTFKNNARRLMSFLLILALALTFIPAPALAGINPEAKPMQSATEFVVALDPDFAEAVLAGEAELFTLEAAESDAGAEAAETTVIAENLAEAGATDEIAAAKVSVDANATTEEGAAVAAQGAGSNHKPNFKKLPPGLLKKESSGKEAHLQNLRRFQEKHSADEPAVITVEVADAGKMAEARAAVELCQGVLYTDPLVYYYADAFNDPRAAAQWGLIPIDAYDAWNDGATGLATVKIAIVDTGVRTTHEDLATSIIAGYNFVENNTDVTDKHGHGTHVAGIAAAISNNSKGIASPAGGAKIMPVRVLGADGLGNSVQVANGIRYAAQQGAQIINLSLGSSTYSRLIEDAVKDALSAGCLVVAAAGNDYTKNAICYPAAQTGVIVASALSANQEHIVVESDFANYSPAYASRTIYAPGEVILSTDYSGDSNYSNKSGTSMATPYVAGMAAALLAKGGYGGSLFDKLLNETVEIPRYYKSGSSVLADPSGAKIKVLNDDGNMDAYESQEFTVTFSGSGDTLPPPQTVKLGEKVLKPSPDPMLTGYNFLGWKKSGETELYDFARPVDADFTMITTWEIKTPVVEDPTQNLGGTVAIIGSARFGQPLTVDPAGLTTDSGAALGTLQYQWNRDGVAIAGAQTLTYTPVQGDVGRILTVTATAVNYAGSVTSEGTLPVAKAYGPAAPATPVLSTATPTSITLKVIPGAEYMRVTYDEFGPGGIWQDSTTFNGLTPNTGYVFCARIKETATHENSSVSAFTATLKTSLESVATPTASPNGGTFSESQNVTLACATTGATIYYTLNGTTPTSGSTKYNGSAFTLTDTATVKAIAVKTDMADSAVLSVTFTKSSSGSTGSGPGGGGGGGGGGGASTGPTVPANNGTVSISFTQSGGTVSLSVPESKINEIIGAAKDDAALFDLSKLTDATGATLPKAALTGFAAAGLETQLKLPTGTLAFDVTAAKDLAAKAGVYLSASLNEVSPASLPATQRAALKAGDLVFNVKAMSGSQTLTEFKGTVTITVPYSGATPVMAWYLNNAGQLEELSSTYSAGAKTVKFTTNHFSAFVVGQAVTQPTTPDKPTAPEQPALPAMPEPPVRPATLFADVTSNNWFMDDVIYVYNKGLMNGTSTDPMLFSPNQPLTRGMIVTILHRLAGFPWASNEATFADVPPGEYYTSAVAWAVANGVVEGYGDGAFGPNDNVSREQLATIMYRYQKFSGNTPPAAVAVKNFGDAGKISSYAQEAVAALTEQGLISGKPGDIFDPQGNASRAEFAAILYRYLNQ